MHHFVPLSLTIVTSSDTWFPVLSGVRPLRPRHIEAKPTRLHKILAWGPDREQCKIRYIKKWSFALIVVVICCLWHLHNSKNSYISNYLDTVSFQDISYIDGYRFDANPAEAPMLLTLLFVWNCILKIFCIKSWRFSCIRHCHRWQHRGLLITTSGAPVTEGWHCEPLVFSVCAPVQELNYVLNQMDGV